MSEAGRTSERRGKLTRLSADIEVARPLGGGIVRLTGRVQAELMQTCVVSLAALPQNLDVAISQDYRPGQATDGVIEVGLEGRDPPEPIGPEGLDLGEAVVQCLSEHLDPYPRAPDAKLTQTVWGEEQEAGNSPFSVLKRLK